MFLRACVGMIVGGAVGLAAICADVALFWPWNVPHGDGAILEIIYLALISALLGSILGLVVGVTGRRELALATLIGLAAGMFVGLITKHNVTVFERFRAGWLQGAGGTIVGLLVAIATVFRARLGAILGGFIGLTIVCFLLAIFPLPPRGPGLAAVFIFLGFPSVLVGAILGMLTQRIGGWVTGAATVCCLLAGLCVGLATMPHTLAVQVWPLLYGGAGAAVGCAFGAVLWATRKAVKRRLESLHET